MNKFEPFPKNPPISKIFREIGYADELGSGMRNTNKYTKLYSGETPVFVEDNIFEILIPMGNVAELQVGPEETNNEALNEAERIIIEIIRQSPQVSQEAIVQKTGYSRSKVQRTMKKLIENKVIYREGAKKNGVWKVFYK